MRVLLWSDVVSFPVVVLPDPDLEKGNRLPEPDLSLSGFESFDALAPAVRLGDGAPGRGREAIG